MGAEVGVDLFKVMWMGARLVWQGERWGRRGDVKEGRGRRSRRRMGRRRRRRSRGPSQSEMGRRVAEESQLLPPLLSPPLTLTHRVM